jgi:hypothetical protein
MPGAASTGARSASTAAAAGMSIVKSSRRGVGNHSVRVPPAMIGCMEYDGTKPAATRPGPPNACSTCCRISFDPFAAHTFAVVRGTPVAAVRYPARSARSATASRSG